MPRAPVRWLIVIVVSVKTNERAFSLLILTVFTFATSTAWSCCTIRKYPSKNEVCRRTPQALPERASRRLCDDALTHAVPNMLPQWIYFS